MLHKKIISPKDRSFQERNGKNNEFYIKFRALIKELQQRELPDFIIEIINNELNSINSYMGEEREIIKVVKKSQRKIVTLLEKELKIVPKSYYQKLWMILGMSVFGLPMGATFGLLSDNMGILGVGLPLGMAIGIAVGNQMDKKALKEGRQLGIELDIY